MMQQMLLATVAIPFLYGAAIAVASGAIPGHRALLTAFLLPLAAMLIHLGLEGLPAFPPVSSRQKLPFILAGGAFLFGLLAISPRPRGTIVTAAIMAILLIVPTWWLGQNILAANPLKVTVVASLLLIVISLFAAGLTREATPDGKTVAGALPVAVLATSIATALAAIMGGYIGMSQFNGALAALTGGWLAVNYVRYLRGNPSALKLDGVAGMAIVWTAVIGLVMTALFAPRAAPLALVFAALPLAVALFIEKRGVTFANIPHALRPLAAGAATALPALIAIGIAVSRFEG